MVKQQSKKETKDPVKSELLVGGIAAAVIVAIIVGVVVFASNNETKVVYEPSTACDRISSDEAKDLLGERVLNSTKNSPLVEGDTAISRCGYTDGNPDTNEAVVVAVTIRSGVNDEGVEKNKSEFAEAKLGLGIESVEGLADDAYWNVQNGQLNILNKYDWIILSYGVGSTPKENTLDDARLLAEKLLN